jgi:hypothetical protein
MRLGYVATLLPASDTQTQPSTQSYAVMPDEIRTSLLKVGNELLVAAFRAFRAGWLDVADLQTINRCTERLTKAVQARDDQRATLLADVIADLSPLRYQYGDRFPEVDRVIETISD